LSWCQVCWLSFSITRISSSASQQRLNGEAALR
jgi:hypothetical protein